MKLILNINEDMSDNTIEMSVKELTPEILKLIEQIQSIDFKLIATKNGKKYHLDFDTIVSIYASNKKNYVLREDGQVFSITETLTNLSKKLPSYFLRISNSEIVNTKKITYFEFTFGGKIKINFKNDHFTYSSRNYLKEIKSYFDL